MMLDPGCCIASGVHQGMIGGQLGLHHNHITSSVATQVKQYGTQKLDVVDDVFAVVHVEEAFGCRQQIWSYV
jgi:hypothetical protein